MAIVSKGKKQNGNKEKITFEIDAKAMKALKVHEHKIPETPFDSFAESKEVMEIEPDFYVGMERNSENATYPFSHYAIVEGYPVKLLTYFEDSETAFGNCSVLFLDAKMTVNEKDYDCVVLKNAKKPGK